MLRDTGCRWVGAVAVAAAILPSTSTATSGAEPLDYRVERTTVRSGFDGRTCWVHARAGAIPPRSPGNRSDRPIVVMTLQKLQLDRSDVFYGLNDLRTDDLGRTWTGPTPHSSLDRRSPREGA